MEIDILEEGLTFFISQEEGRHGGQGPGVHLKPGRGVCKEDREQGGLVRPVCWGGNSGKAIWNHIMLEFECWRKKFDFCSAEWTVVVKFASQFGFSLPKGQFRKSKK